MKKMSKALVALAAAAALVGLAACSNSSDSSSASSEWLPVTNKADLIGTWVGSWSDGTSTVKLAIRSDYTGEKTESMPLDLSSKSSNEITKIINKMDAMLTDGGYTTYDASAKVLSMTYPIGYNPNKGNGTPKTLDYLLPFISIHVSKTQIMLTQVDMTTGTVLKIPMVKTSSSANAAPFASSVQNGIGPEEAQDNAFGICSLISLPLFE